MRKLLVKLLATSCLLAAFSTPVSALQYDFAAPDAGLFGMPTSDSTTYVTTGEPLNTDRSKTVAYIPPVFGSPMPGTSAHEAPSHVIF